MTDSEELEGKFNHKLTLFMVFEDDETATVVSDNEIIEEIDDENEKKKVPFIALFKFAKG
jgi:uncharacterized protein (DUF1697 family)